MTNSKSYVIIQPISMLFAIPNVCHGWQFTPVKSIIFLNLIFSNVLKSSC